jgi:hypothetical protein
MLDLSKDGFLTMNEIKKNAPSIFTSTPSPDTSEKYTHIPTSIVIEDMEKLGWGVVDAKEVKARKGVGFQKHLLVFRNPDVVINGEDGDTVFPQILLTNSHDGKNSFTFTAGLFRLVCENGLVVSTQEFENVKLRHMGYTFEELQERIKEMVERLPLTVDSLNKMKQKKVEEKEAIQFAKKALTTRFTEDQIKVFKIDLKELIKPTRKEDEGSDLWSVFNVVQEKILTGDFTYKSGGKVRKARQIKNFNQDLKVNKELFEMALELV